MTHQIQGFTEHAVKRMQQRGLSREAVDLIEQYGRTRYDHRGAQIVFLDRRSRERLMRCEGKAAYLAHEKALKAYVVLSTDGEAVTAGHRYRRLLSH